jgi:hypothetical protein
MVTSLSPGDTLRIGDCLTLTVLAVEGDLIRFGVEFVGSGGPGAKAHVEGGNESALNGWEAN